MLSQCLVLSITKKSHFLLVGSGTTFTYSLSNTKFFDKVIQCVLKSLETFNFNFIAIVMPGNTNKTKKFWNKF